MPHCCFLAILTVGHVYMRQMTLFHSFSFLRWPFLGFVFLWIPNASRSSSSSPHIQVAIRVPLPKNAKVASGSNVIGTSHSKAVANCSTLSNASWNVWNRDFPLGFGNLPSQLPAIFHRSSFLKYETPSVSVWMRAVSRFRPSNGGNVEIRDGGIVVEKGRVLETERPWTIYKCKTVPTINIELGA